MLALMIVFALQADAQSAPPQGPPPERDGYTLPRSELPPVREKEFHGQPTDPLFSKERKATDDPAFVSAAVEAGRQAIVDARTARERVTDSPSLRSVAGAIERQNQETTRKLEQIATRKGWRLPPDIQDRPASQAADAKLDDTNYIQNQIAAHESTVALFRAQSAGQGDAEVKKAVKDALPALERNLKALLEIQPKRVDGQAATK